MMPSAELIDVQSLIPGSRIDVETRNRHYRIECLGGKAMRISGHPEYCPDPVPGLIEGSANQIGLVEPGFIERGMYLRFLIDHHRPVTTSRVMKISVSGPGTADEAAH
jgi:hypothetical protein